MDLESSKEQQNSPADQAIADLRQGGTLSRHLSGYQERPAQIEMAEVVVQALSQGRHAVVEAGTGTGKSLAYLIPVVRSGRRVIISTANKALQDQIFEKDIPFVQTYVQQFEAVEVKGSANYICLRRMEIEANEGLFVYTGDEQLKQVIEATEDEDFDGDFGKLPFPVSNDLRELIAVDTDQCAWSKCPLYSKCYAKRMKDRAKDALVIVTNHYLTLLDAIADGQILPEASTVIVDECHTLEGVATETFTVRLKPTSISSLLSLKRLKAVVTGDTHFAASEQLKKTWAWLDGMFPEKRGELQPRMAFTEAIEEGLHLASRIAAVVRELHEREPLGADPEELALYKKVVERAEKLLAELRAVFSVSMPGEYVYFLERITKRGFSQIEVARVPLSVARDLQQSLFEKKAVICTSATISTGENFQFYRQQIGLAGDKVLEKILPLVFNYQQNALLYLPVDVPEPAYGGTLEERKYQAAIAERMYQLVQASKGRAFLLFSSKRMLEAVHAQIGSRLSYPTFVQGTYAPRELLRQFRASGNGVLFGLKSFWEGVDVAGEALSLVVIDKLPFVPLDDPVLKARKQIIDSRGGRSFSEYDLPGVIIRLKQGIGRLIRTDTDRGIMAILDRRMTSKGYARTIRESLPPARITHRLEDVQQFFYVGDSEQGARNTEPCERSLWDVD